MNKLVAQQIKRHRQNSELSQDNMADELGITKGAYSKIERGLTAIKVDRLAQIAKVFNVEVESFLIGKEVNLLADPNQRYGFATKSEIEELVHMINALKQEIQALKNNTDVVKKDVKKKK